jgi:hypothetical protein
MFISDFDYRGSHVLLRPDQSSVDLSKTGVHQRFYGWPLAWTRSFWRFCLGTLFLFMAVFLIRSSAIADVAYPVVGVFASISPDYPGAASESCIALKMFGLESVSKSSISEVIIFTNKTRYDEVQRQGSVWR